MEDSKRTTATLTNNFDGQSYFVSIGRVSKRIHVPPQLSGDKHFDKAIKAMNLGGLDFNYISLQAAIYPISVFRRNLIRCLLSKPIFVINLDDPLKRVGIEEFKAFLTRLLIEEKFEDVYSEPSSLEIFEKHGYAVTRYDVRTLLGKVKNIFIFHDPRTVPQESPSSMPQ